MSGTRVDFVARVDRVARVARVDRVARVARLALLALVALAAPSLAGPATQDPCPDAAAPEPFVDNADDFENLHFHGGLLYATGSDNLLQAIQPDGTATTVASLGARSGAMVTGNDGALYVRVGGSEVWRFGALPTDAHTVVATGLAGANGMAIDAAGNIYVSSESGDVIYKLPASDMANAAVWAQLYGPNGIVVDDAAGVLYAAQTTDGRSTIAAVALADPTNVTQVASLSFGFAQLDLFDQPPLGRAVPPSDPTSPLVPKGVDDLALGPDGMLYLAAWVTGEIVRLDPATGAACVVASGIEQPSSVRFAEGFGETDGDLYVTHFGGHAGLVAPLPAGIVRVPLGPAPELDAAINSTTAPPRDEARAVPGPAALPLLALLAAPFARRSR